MASANFVEKSVDFVTDADCNGYLIDASKNDIKITLQELSDCHHATNSGWYFKRVDDSKNTVVIIPSSKDKIDGEDSINLEPRQCRLLMRSNNYGWCIISSSKTKKKVTSFIKK